MIILVFSARIGNHEIKWFDHGGALKTRELSWTCYTMPFSLKHSFSLSIQTINYIALASNQSDTC